MSASGPSGPLVFLVLSLIYRIKWLISKKTIIFQGSRGGPTFSRGGGGPTFSRGSNCLFPIETHITCDFPGGSGPPVPPLDPHLEEPHYVVSHNNLGLNSGKLGDRFVCLI